MNPQQSRPNGPSRSETTVIATQSQAGEMRLRDGTPFMPSAAHWKQLLEIGAAAHRSGMIPSSIRNPEAAAIIALKAFELGISMMDGFSQLHVVNGRPGISRELMQVLVYRNIPGAKIKVIKSTSDEAEVEGTRPGQEPLTVSFTMEDARRANLTGKDNWKQYPRAMLLNRAISELCRFYFVDALHGCIYTPEELEPAIETTGRTLSNSQGGQTGEPQTSPNIPPSDSGSHSPPASVTPLSKQQAAGEIPPDAHKSPPIEKWTDEVSQLGPIHVSRSEAKSEGVATKEPTPVDSDLMPDDPENFKPPAGKWIGKRLLEIPTEEIQKAVDATNAYMKERKTRPTDLKPSEYLLYRAMLTVLEKRLPKQEPGEDE